MGLHNECDFPPLPVGGGGGMSAETYDPEGAVAEAGGIPAYVEEHGGGGGGLPPVTGSGKALVSINGQWKQQEGFPYDEGENVTTLFDKTFTGFTFDEDENAFISIIPVDEPLPDYDSSKTYRVYVDGDVLAEGWYDGYIELNEDGTSYVEDLGDGTVRCYLNADDYSEAPASMSIKLDEVVSGVHPMDGKLLFGENAQDGTALVNVGGEMTKQDGYAYRTPEDYNELYSADSTVIVSGIGTQIYNCSAAITDDEYDVGETIVHPTFYDYGADPDNAIGIYLHHWGNFTPEFSEQSGDVGVIRHDDEMWIIVNNPSSTAGSDLNNCYFEYPGIYTNYSEGDPFFRFVIIGSGDYVACFSERGNVGAAIRGIRINSSGILEVYYSDYYSFGDGSVIAAAGILLAVLLSEEDSQYISDDSATVTLYSVEGGVVPFNSDFIPWDEIPSEDIPWYDAPVGTGLPEPTYEDGTYILQATETDGEMEYAWQSASQSGGKVIAEFEVDWDSGSGDPTGEMEYAATCNMTAQEIYDAALSGQNVVVRVKMESGFDELHLMRVGYQDAETNEFGVEFQQINTLHEIHGAKVIKIPYEDSEYFGYIESYR